MSSFPQYEPLCHELLARAELALGDLERAEGHARRGAAVAERLALPIPLAEGRRAEAIVVLERGRAREAVGLAIAAVDATEATGAAIEMARSRIVAGRALAAAGERDRAVIELRDAHEHLFRCGAFRCRDKAARELRKLGCAVRHVGEVTDDSAVAGLSGREVEVMEFVAAGKTNREIAALLFLSVRPVDRHLSRIFEELGVSSRAAAASKFERARTGRLPQSSYGHLPRPRGKATA